jgi:hypothetical protein
LGRNLRKSCHAERAKTQHIDGQLAEAKRPHCAEGSALTPVSPLPPALRRLGRGESRLRCTALSGTGWQASTCPETEVHVARAQSCGLAECEV